MVPKPVALLKIEADIAKLMAETVKLHAEAARLNAAGSRALSEELLYPFAAGAGVFGVTFALAKLFTN